MPVPKRRKSASRSRMQRAANMKLEFAALPATCQSCGEPKLAHRICRACGKYAKREIIPVVAEKN